MKLLASADINEGAIGSLESVFYRTVKGWC